MCSFRGGCSPRPAVREMADCSRECPSLRAGMLNVLPGRCVAAVNARLGRSSLAPWRRSCERRASSFWHVDDPAPVDHLLNRPAKRLDERARGKDRACSNRRWSGDSRERKVRQSGSPRVGGAVRSRRDRCANSSTDSPPVPRATVLGLRRPEMGRRSDPVTRTRRNWYPAIRCRQPFSGSSGRGSSSSVM